ncbi:MAG: glycosyltransferase family 2 protein [Saprospiraceae bacterium]
MKLSVIIVNYNVKYFLEQVLHSVRRASEGLAVEVFVVDNNSVDDSVAMVREKFPEVILIANKENTGFSVANNQAIRVSKGEYVLLLNPDTVVEEATFSKVINFMDEHPEAGGLGVKMIDGSGEFLPESKRGFPSPWVAFCKTTGLSKLFPKSPKFNRYHLGYLDKDETHEIEVLAGAFMMMRKSVLDEIGLLDEAFFMYGEDIDLSYRIVKAGYKNYYFADTTIIHYKGESTKKGSLNYVRTFYNAMIIFAKKHFQGEQAKLYVFMLYVAIYLRAFLTLVTNFFQRAAAPILDAILIIIGMIVLKDFWEIRFYDDPNYYPEYFDYFNIPLYTIIWLTAIYYSGGYDNRQKWGKIARGVFIGTILLAAVYGFLDERYRTSRILILMGATWAGIATIGWRMLVHFAQHRKFSFAANLQKNFIIIGSKTESERVLNLIRAAEVYNNFIGTVSPNETEDFDNFIGNFYQLDEIVQIYKIHEIIFCSKDVAAEHITKWMTKIGTSVEYKIVPEKSLSIIGSRSKNSTGQLYTIDIEFTIKQPMHQRNKRFLDVIFSIGILVTLPISIWFVRQKFGLIRNIFSVLFNHKSWVGYHGKNVDNLPKIKKSVLSPVDGLKVKKLQDSTIQHLNLLYAKDYSVYHDLDLIWSGFRELGR